VACGIVHSRSRVRVAFALGESHCGGLQLPPDAALRDEPPSAISISWAAARKPMPPPPNA
jgi:hypothetical protein